MDRRMIHAHFNKNGQSLVEVMLAMALLVIVWISAVNVVAISKASGSIAKHKAQAAYVIQKAIEELRRQPFDTISSSTSSVIIDTRGTPDTSSDDIIGTQVVTVTSPDTYYKYVSVRLTWNNILMGKTKPMTEYCATYIAGDSQAN